MSIQETYKGIRVYGTTILFNEIEEIHIAKGEVTIICQDTCYLAKVYSCNLTEVELIKK